MLTEKTSRLQWIFHFVRYPRPLCTNGPRNNESFMSILYFLKYYICWINIQFQNNKYVIILNSFAICFAIIISLHNSFILFSLVSALARGLNNDYFFQFMFILYKKYQIDLLFNSLVQKASLHSYFKCFSFQYIIFITQFSQFFMTNINSSLLGFLKKKTLFSDSPAKSLRFRQRSNQKKSIVESVKTPRNAHDNNVFKNNNESSNKLNRLERENHSSPGVVEFVDVNHSVQIDRPTRFNNSFHNYQLNKTMVSPKRNFNFNMNSKNTLTFTQNKDQENSQIWTGLVNYSGTFESARIQSVQCLEGMSKKIQGELSKIQQKMVSFEKKMTDILNNQFIKMKQKIFDIIQKVFEESEKQMRIYLKNQQQFLGNELKRMKDLLTKQYEKIELMKQEINKPTWKKTVGQLLSSEMEQKLDALINKSQQISLGDWQIEELTHQKIQSLQHIVKDIAKLNEI